MFGYFRSYFHFAFRLTFVLSMQYFFRPSFVLFGDEVAKA